MARIVKDRIGNTAFDGLDKGHFHQRFADLESAVGCRCCPAATIPITALPRPSDSTPSRAPWKFTWGVGLRRSTIDCGPMQFSDGGRPDCSIDNAACSLDGNPRLLTN
jgi:hypothetical protein